MRSDPPFFQLLHNEKKPVGHFGRGTHYSVLRALCWHAPDLTPLSRAVFHDFAVIWDEDHDKRVIQVAQRILMAGLLAPVFAIGERKGMLTVAVSTEAARALGPDGLEAYRERLAPLARPDDDWWSLAVTQQGSDDGIIAATRGEIDLYLQGIDLLWHLGSKSTEKPGVGLPAPLPTA